MCGITGAVGDPFPDRAAADRMCRAIRHRGPDDQGIYYEPPAFLGMRRLSIIDLEGGHQPIGNEDGSVWLVFNGEIYNYRELRPELQARGHRFASQSDSECIVHAYEEYGEACFERLRGMFAIALWDARRKRLLLARDRLGKKPLYYRQAPGGLAFASELKSLLELPEATWPVDRTALRDYLVLGYVPTSRCIFKGVAKLPPAHYLVYEAGALRVCRYWQLRFEPKWQEPEPILEERLAALLDDAVKARLVSDVPFGAFLSGGVDSSLVVALMARHLAMPVRTFTIGFEEPGSDEIPDARVVARHVGTEHVELVAEPDAARLLQDLVWYLDEPFGDSSAIPTFLVSQLARRHVKMVLSGDGGDELFAGYERYARFAVVDRLARIGGPLVASSLNAAAALIPGASARRVRWLAQRVGMPFPASYLSGVALSTREQLEELLQEPLNGAGLFSSVEGLFLRPGIGTGLDRVMAGDIDSYLPDDILVKVDRMTMASSLEARAPLLDHALVEFAARLPLRLKRRGGRGKYLLRRVAGRLLPASVLTKRKQGFAIPLAAWLRRELRELAQDVFASRAFRERGVFDAAAVERCLADHVSGAADHGEHLWLVLGFEMWARRFTDKADGVPR
jgi:asparagine synthase (glutamine-hydrolysing)